MNVPARCKHNLFGVGQICEMRGQMALYCSKVPSLPLQLFAGDLRLKLPTIQPHAHLWWDPAPWTPGPAAGLAASDKMMGFGEGWYEEERAIEGSRRYPVSTIVA